MNVTAKTTELSPARGRRLVRFRNCFCGVQAVKFMDGSFLCQRHWEADRARLFQDPEVTAANIKECNARCEKRRSERLKSVGLCVTCGKRESNLNATRCEVCQAKRRALQASYRMRSEFSMHPWLLAKHRHFSTCRVAELENQRGSVSTSEA
jgi:hypothetical protein